MDATRSMVFVNTKITAEKVSRRLERQGFRVGVLSGDVPQKKRQTLLARFQRGDIELLIATDVAARGLHVPDVSHVFNYDLPQDAEDYVHRIGRTARLGAEGDAVSFACDLYAMSLPDIETYIGQKIPVGAIDPALLVLPPPRHRPDAIPSENADENAAEAAADAEIASGIGVVSKKPTGPSKGRRPGGGGGRPGGRSGPRPGSSSGGGR